MSDSYGDGYGTGMPPNRDAIVQALLNVQNPPPGGATQTGMPAGPALPTPGGVAGGSTPTPFAAPPGAVGSNLAPPPAGIGGRGFAPPIPANPAAQVAAPAGMQPGYNSLLGNQMNQMNAPYGGMQQLPGGPGNLVPNLGQQLPPGGLPRY